MEQLLALGELAPLGRGTETVTDTTMRSTIQLGPELVKVQAAVGVIGECG